MTKNTLLCGLLTASVALAAAGPAGAAKTVKYDGRTSAATAVFLKRSGNTVTDLRAWLPAACASSRTSDTRAGTEAFALPEAVAIGGEQKVSAQQAASMNTGSSAVTKNYTVTLSRAKGAKGAITGKISLNFMLVEPYFNAMGYLDGNTFICGADATFTAKPVAAKKTKKRR